MDICFLDICHGGISAEDDCDLMRDAIMMNDDDDAINE